MLYVAPHYHTINALKTDIFGVKMWPVLADTAS